MNSNGFQREISVVVQAVRDAAELVLEVYGTQFLVDLKAASEPVTLADRRSNELLCQRIAQAFPLDGIVAEESVPTDPDALAWTVQRQRLWLIDPLDGTKEFIARNGEFAIMVGLAIGGRPVLGIVGLPAKGEIWVGISDERTFRINADGSQTECKVSNVSDFAQATLVMSRSHRSRSLIERVEQLGVHQTLACGSVGIKASRIAAAEADLYVYLHAKGGAKLWDGCAPEALVLGSGGKVTNVHGGAIDYATTQLELNGGFIATNGLLHDRLLERIQIG